MAKKAVILEHGGGELANQLWNYASVAAFVFEKNLKLRNPSFYEYHSCFTMLPRESPVTKIRSLFFKKPRRRSHPINRFGRFKYSIQAKIISMFKSTCVISSKNTHNEVTYLPPTKELPESFGHCKTVYFSGWLFRNPKGLEKHREKILEYFRPASRIEIASKKFVYDAREKCGHVVGVHIRQGDYKIFKQGKYLVSEHRVREILDEYLRFSGKNAKDTCFLIASDGPVNPALFEGLNIRISNMNAVEDLFMLSKTDIIIGSDSSFGDFAAWYGDIPHIVFKNEPIDWDYYKDKTGFFYNKYCTLVQY